MPFKLGWQEIVIILAIVLIIFGVGKFPQIRGAISKRFHRAKTTEPGEKDKSKDIASSLEQKK